MRSTLLFVLLLQFSAFSQCDSTDIVAFPDVEAHFPGSITEMLQFIKENSEYPELDASIVESGRIYIEFIVCQDGSITNIALHREVSENLKKMSIDLISKMPNWIPAEHGGKIVASKCRIPITICFN